MKIALFISGQVRTLFYCFEKNLEVISNAFENSEIDLFYSFWDTTERSNRINDSWHFRVEDYEKKEITKNNLENYFKRLNILDFEGDIESCDLMNNVIKNSPFRDKFLSSQYYKNHTVVDRYHKKQYDICIKLRSDILINNFLKEEQINEVINNDSLFVNKYYWYNALYTGVDCNEMLFVTNNNIFKTCNSLYCEQDELSIQIKNEKQYGECITGTYFNNLLKTKKINKINSFDFEYRVVR